MKMTELYIYLNKLGLADQVHFRNGNQVVFYHWNKTMSELLPSVTIENSRIERLYYGRKFMPRAYILCATEFENDFDGQGFIRDYRDEVSDGS